MDNFKKYKELIALLIVFTVSFVAFMMDMPMMVLIGAIASVTLVAYKINIRSLRRYVSLAMVMMILVTVTVGCNSTSDATNKKEEISSDNGKEESKKPDTNHTEKPKEDSNNKKNEFEGYRLIEVDGGNLSGHREPNVVVDIGFGDREYYAFTNEHGQLVKVTAKEIILQDDSKEPVTSSGRYYKDEAKVPGTERKDLDEGHIIADSLGGVSNAYNITPQDSTLNRHGQQAYMEKVIRDAGGCSDFVAIITYSDTKTQIPSHYSYTYTLKGKIIKDEFENINPEKDKKPSNENTSSNTNNNTNNKNEVTSNNSNTGGVKPIDTSLVYWTPNGKSYHTTKECSTLSRSKTILEGTKAKSGKNDTCDKCD
ncbi:MAG: DNA/RNA non-specific endonuclease [Clostridium sp.]